MALEDHFEFIGEDSIRIAGTRIGIETVLEDYLEGASPEEICLRYPTLSLLQIYATITYYLDNQERIEAYLRCVARKERSAWEEQQRRPSAFVRDLRERLARERRKRFQETLP